MAMLRGWAKVGFGYMRSEGRAGKQYICPLYRQISMKVWENQARRKI